MDSKRPNLCGFAGYQATIRLRAETLADQLPCPPLSKSGPRREPCVCKGDTQVAGLAGLLLILDARGTDSCSDVRMEPVNLSVQEVKKKIEELNIVRSRRRKWLAGASLCAVGIMTVCLLTIRSAAVSLLQDGPTHDEFVADLTREIAKQILPQMDEYGVQASCGTLPLSDPSLPVARSHHTSGSAGGTDEVYGPLSRTKGPSSMMDGEKTNAGICGATDDPEKPLGRFREQTVSEYQATVNKIIDDLAAIRGREGNDTHAGLSAGAVACLFISRVEEGLPKPPREGYSPQADRNFSKDAR
jgi:hypothetical protein